MRAFLSFLCWLPSLAFALTTQNAIDQDLSKVLKTAGYPIETILYSFTEGPNAQVDIKCNKANQFMLVVSAPKAEAVSTLYFGVGKLGFLFPHPRMQVSPTLEHMTTLCNQTFRFNPTLRYRGFHLQTQYPNEWVSGLFGNESAIGVDFIRWLAHNQQNILQIQMIRGPLSQYRNSMSEALSLARALNINVGVSASFSMFQQKSRFLIPIWSSLTGIYSDKKLNASLDELLSVLQPSFVTLELGTSEFTPTSYKRTLGWINAAGSWAQKNQVKLFVRANTSTSQYNRDFGNFNFLPVLALPAAGLLVHTTYFYDLNDRYVPMYDRQSFSDLKQLLISENKKRPVWYQPETGHFLGLDFDVPLFLTDYLVARANDYKFAVETGLPGHLNLTAGQELGHWLFDWNVALQTNPEYVGDAYAGLKLLGEDLQTWKTILDYQTKHFKNNQVIQMISTSTLMDELPYRNPTHTRNLVRDLWRKPTQLDDEISRLNVAIEEFPFEGSIKNDELKSLMTITKLRLQHALYVREAIRASVNDKTKTGTWLSHAKKTRGAAAELMKAITANHSHYPEAKLFEKQKNPTSYQYGYGYTARSLWYWEREERIVSEQESSPFFLNLDELRRILF